MHKKISSILLTVTVLITFFTACAPKDKETPRDGASTYADFIDSGKIIAVQSGDIFNTVARDLFKAAEVPEYAVMSDMLADLRLGRADAVITDDAYVKPLQNSGAFPEFGYIPVPEEFFISQSAPVFHTSELRDKYDEWLAVIKEDGTFDEIADLWLGASLPAQEDIPKFEFTGENGTLRVCNTGNYPPFSCYDANGEPAGFDIDLISRFAQYLGMELEVTMMAYEAIIPYVNSGKADMSACEFAITDERGESSLFGAPTIATRAVLIVPDKNVRDYTDFIGKEIGVNVGAITEQVVLENFNGTPAYYSEMTAGIEDVRNRRTDGFMMDYSTLRLIAVENEDLTAIEVPAEFFRAGIGGISNNQELLGKFNAMLSELEADGSLAEIQKFWLEEITDLSAPMPDIPLTGENGILRIAATADAAPFAYIGENGEMKGFSIELALRFAAREGMNIEFIEMEFGALIPHVISGKSDMGLANISITDERKKSVGFTAPYCYDTLGIIALQPDAAVSDAGGDKAGFIETFTTAVERNLLTENRWKMIANGFGVTMTIAFMAQVFGTVFGCFVCWLLMRKNRLVKRLGGLYCGLIHGTPVVVVLMIAYYIIFGDTTISNELVAIAAFTMVTGAGVAVNLKGAIETVDPVEIEAARSIGFSSFKAFRAVTLPQAVRRALPAYTNGFVELVKATAIVGYVAIQDMMRAADIIRSRTYDAFFPLLLVAVIYLAVTTICVQLFKFIVRKMNRGGAVL